MSKKLLIAGAIATAIVSASGIAIAGGEEEAGSVSGDPHFVSVDEIAVPIVGSDRVDGKLRVKLVLEAADADAATMISDRLPELRATSVAAAVEFSRLYASALAAVNAEQLNADMTEALTRQYPAVARVLIVEVAAQQI